MRGPHTFPYNASNPAFSAEYRKWILPLIEKYEKEIRSTIADNYAADAKKLNWFQIFQDMALSNARLRADLSKIPESLSARLKYLSGTVDRNIKVSLVKLAQKSHKYKNSAGKTAKVMIPAIRFTANRAERAFMRASVVENAALIRSIGEDSIERATQAISNSVQNGGSRADLFEALSHGFGISKRRAANIAIDQTNKMTEQLSIFKMQSIGITHGKWIHSHGDKKPRETHLKFDGKVFELKKGLYDTQVKKWVKPGELINCTCTYEPVVPDDWIS